MAKREKKLDRVIAFLKNENERLIQEIQQEHGQSKDKIELKEQINDAIANLELCENHNVFANDVEVFELPIGGSEAHFTDFYIVDEAEIEKVPDWAIMKSGEEAITLNCFDLLIRK